MNRTARLRLVLPACWLFAYNFITGRLKMDPTTNSATQILIAEMEQTINRMKRLSAAHSQIPLSMENSTARKRLYDRFKQERAHFFMFYGQDRSFRLEALNPNLFLEFNQYLIDHVCGIDNLHQAPTFMEYLLIEKP